MIRRFSSETEVTINTTRDFWDQRNAGRSSAFESFDLDAQVVETIERVHRDDDALAATAEFKRALFAQLMNAAAESSHRPGITSDPLRPAMIPEESATRQNNRQSGRPGPRWLWSVAPSVAGLLLLFLIVASISIWRSGSTESHRVVPLKTVVTEEGVVIRTLVEEHVPAGALPGDPTRWVAAIKFSLEPGEYWRDTPDPCEASRLYVVGMVESGTLAMITDGPFEIRRSNGSVEIIEAGQRGNVHTGDSWVYVSGRTEMLLNKWNPGSKPMVAFESTWALDQSCEGIPANPEWIWHGSKLGIRFDDSRPVVVRLDQIFVEPGAILSRDDAERIGLVPASSDVLRVFGIESGVLEQRIVPIALRLSLPGAESSIGARVFQSGDGWSPQNELPAEEGHEWQFRNGSDQTLVMTAFAWAYDDGEPGPEEVQASTEIASLADISVPAGTISRATPGQLIISNVVVPAGESIAYPESCSAPVMTVALVESGSYLILADGNLQITRANGDVEFPESRSSVVVHAGDGYVHLNQGEAGAGISGNAHDEPATILQAVWFAEEACSYGPAGSDERMQVTWIATDRLPVLGESPAFEFRIERLTLTPFDAHSRDELLGFELPAGPADNLALLVVETGTVQDRIEMITGSSIEVIHSARHGRGEILNLDNSLGLGSNTVREFFATGNVSAEVTIISVQYNDDPG